MTIDPIIAVALGVAWVATFAPLHRKEKNKMSKDMTDKESLTVQAMTAEGRTEWVLVPKEPTFDMWQAGSLSLKAHNDTPHMDSPTRKSAFIESYKAAIAAAPPVAQAEPTKKPCFCSDCGSFEGNFHAADCIHNGVVAGNAAPPDPLTLIRATLEAAAKKCDARAVEWRAFPNGHSQARAIAWGNASEDIRALNAAEILAAVKPGSGE